MELLGKQDKIKAILKAKPELIDALHQLITDVQHSPELSRDFDHVRSILAASDPNEMKARLLTAHTLTGGKFMKKLRKAVYSTGYVRPSLREIERKSMRRDSRVGGDSRVGYYTHLQKGGFCGCKKCMRDLEHDMNMGESY